MLVVAFCPCLRRVHVVGWWVVLWVKSLARCRSQLCGACHRPTCRRSVP